MEKVSEARLSRPAAADRASSDLANNIWSPSTFITLLIYNKLYAICNTNNQDVKDLRCMYVYVGIGNEAAQFHF
jgi:hypothetical protein